MTTHRQALRRKLQRLAADQHGYFTAAQALETGYSYQAQKHHVDYGNWARVDRGLFRIPEWPVSQDDHLVRWTLWSGGQAVVSHATALSVHNLGDIDPAAVHLSVPQDFRRSAPGLVLHRPSPPSEHVEERDGYRITTPGRALAECAEMRIEQQWLDTAVEEAISLGLTSARRLRDIAANRASGRTGYPQSFGGSHPMSAKYSTAIRAALDVRLLEQARQQGRDPNWIRRRLAFTRLLVRLADQDAHAWVLKGGMAVELRRPGLARSTKDLDLVLRPGLVSDPSNAVELHEVLVEALLEDSDADGLVFNIALPSRLRDDAYGRPQWRFPVKCQLAGRRFTDMKLDVVARPEEIGGVEQRELPDVLGFAGIPTRSIWVVDLRQQYAEKLHALTRSYETGESTRVKDLVDLLLLIEDGVPADAALVARVNHVFTVRKAHAVPTDLPDPPAAWQAPYTALAQEIGLSDTSHVNAHAIVAAHWHQAQSRGQAIQ